MQQGTPHVLDELHEVNVHFHGMGFAAYELVGAPALVLTCGSWVRLPGPRPCSGPHCRSLALASVVRPPLRSHPLRWVEAAAAAAAAAEASAAATEAAAAAEAAEAQAEAVPAHMHAHQHVRIFASQVGTRPCLRMAHTLRDINKEEPDGELQAACAVAVQGAASSGMRYMKEQGRSKAPGQKTCT